MITLTMKLNYLTSSLNFFLCIEQSQSLIKIILGGEQFLRLQILQKISLMLFIYVPGFNPHPSTL